MLAPFDSPRLLADVGGTYARFAVETAQGMFAQVASLRCAEHADFHAALTTYLAGLPAGTAARLRHAAVAIANPVEGDQVRMTNYTWEFSIEAMRERLGLQTLVVINDFTALAMALPRLGAGGRRQVGSGQARDRSVIGLLGAGTGLGLSGLIPAHDGWVALGTEGGHSTFAPRDESELEILRFAMREFEHVSFERLISGPGIELTYRALRHAAGQPDARLPAFEITRRALDGSDALCVQTVNAFCGMLGTAAGNLAVTLGAFGGVYIGGGIVPRLGEFFDRSPFRARFEQKGRFSGYVKAVPTFVITDERATFIGASTILAEQLRAAGGTEGGTTLLGQIRRLQPGLSPAERRVAEQVLAHPRSALIDPIATIARQAAVSQPTVIRFCRSLGCEGLSDFKLRLAAGLTASVPVTHTQVTGEDNVLELGVKVLGNTASAILRVRDQLNRDAIGRAIELLSEAQRIEFYAFGHYRVVADDAQFKFLRFGISSASYTDPRLLRLAADALRAGDVAVVVSSSGRVEDLLYAADAAHARGASVVAITAGQTPLARKADVALIVDHVEDIDTQLPMISRILHLLVIDILAVGVAMRRGVGAGALPLGADAPGEGVERRPGVHSASPLSRMTTHSR